MDERPIPAFHVRWDAHIGEWVATARWDPAVVLRDADFARLELVCPAARIRHALFGANLPAESPR